MALKFKSSREDLDLIRKILDRAMADSAIADRYASRLDLLMDIEAVHENGNPLRLADLLAAPDADFNHDLHGICNCLDRDTGKLQKGFRPRFSQREEMGG